MRLYMDYKSLKNELDIYGNWEDNNKLDVLDRVLEFPGVAKDDRVNSPSHYTSGSREVIDTIEDAVKDAPDAIQGMLQAQVLKYMLRIWLKDNPAEDARKAQWYLNRLIEHMEEPPGDNFPGDNLRLEKW